MRVGLPASFSVDAFPRRSFPGEVRQIRESPTNAQKAVSYTVVISAANPDLALLPGMTAKVRVTVGSRQSVLKMPNTALRFRPPTDDDKAAAKADAKRAGGGRRDGADKTKKRSVYVLVHGRLDERELELGLADERFTEVLGGELAEGEAVVIGIETPVDPNAKAASPAQPQGQPSKQGGGRMGGRGGFL